MKTTSTYSISSDGIADLGLSAHLDDRLRAALADSDEAGEIRSEIEEAVNAQLAIYGVDGNGGWLGDWSATDIVTGVLAAHGA